MTERYRHENAVHPAQGMSDMIIHINKLFHYTSSAAAGQPTYAFQALPAFIPPTPGLR